MLTVHAEERINKVFCLQKSSAKPSSCAGEWDLKVIQTYLRKDWSKRQMIYKGLDREVTY